DVHHEVSSAERNDQRVVRHRPAIFPEGANTCVVIDVFRGHALPRCYYILTEARFRTHRALLSSHQARFRSRNSDAASSTGQRQRRRSSPPYHCPGDRFWPMAVKSRMATFTPSLRRRAAVRTISELLPIWREVGT